MDHPEARLAKTAESPQTRATSECLRSIAQQIAQRANDLALISGQISAEDARSAINDLDGLYCMVDDLIPYAFERAPSADPQGPRTSAQRTARAMVELVAAVRS